MCSVCTNYDKVGALINNGFEAAKRYGAQAAQNPKHRNQRPNPRPNPRPEPNEEPTHAHTLKVTAPAAATHIK